jgi:hypothetical protein
MALQALMHPVTSDTRGVEGACSQTDIAVQGIGRVQARGVHLFVMTSKAQQIIKLVTFMAVRAYHIIVHGPGTVQQGHRDQAAESKCKYNEVSQETLLRTIIAHKRF